MTFEQLLSALPAADAYDFAEEPSPGLKGHRTDGDEARVVIVPADMVGHYLVYIRTLNWTYAFVGERGVPRSHLAASVRRIVGEPDELTWRLTIGEPAPTTVLEEPFDFCAIDHRIFEI